MSPKALQYAIVDLFGDALSATEEWIFCVRFWWDYRVIVVEGIDSLAGCCALFGPAT
jgi:hypothetical protein